VPYLHPHQSRTRPTTSYESALAAELERVYASGAHTLPAVVAGLNLGGVRPAGGADWTEQSVTAELARLAAEATVVASAPAPLDPTGPRGVTLDSPADLLTHGLRDQWYALCPGTAVPTGELVRLHRAGLDLLLWRDSTGEVHVQRDRCPHRSVPLSMGVHLGDRVACNYHGVQVDGTGTVVSVPGSPGCALEGRPAVATFPATEVGGAIWAWIGDAATPTEPAPLHLPEQLVGEEWAAFLCYVEWDAPYGFSLDNLMDPMHGAFLHRDSHTMFGGKREAVFQVRDTPTGFVFEKTDQKSVNFDWSEWIDDGYQAVRLDIPYPPSAGPGGPFAIIATVTPIGPAKHAAFFWRCRRVTGWERDSWRFLYRTLLEERHWDVLEQDRAMLDVMPLDAWEREGLYQHDIALVRVRRLLRNRAESYVRDRAARAGAAPKQLAAAR
jgi:phenylpropionate dioxygenase-like ring-hydroxylating dioxygenase large terminal subunit